MIMPEITVKLDQFDKKLLYFLDRDSKADLSILAKKLNRSKPFVLYRMRRLEQEGVLTSYTAIVDMSKLGYFTFRVYFKFQQMTKDALQQVVEHVRTSLTQVWTITTMHGKWDLALFLCVRSIAEFHTIWDSIMLRYKDHIKAYNVAVYAPIYNFNRAFFIETNEEPLTRVYGDGEKEDIDTLDQRIIEAYAPNARATAVDIAKKLGISSDTVRNRIKKLEQRKIIVGYKIGLDLEKLGFVSFRVDLQLRSTKRNRELFEFCRMHPNIYQINNTIGGADFEIEVIVRDTNHLFEVIDELKTRFTDVINDADSFGFSTFHILAFIPD